jgi:hypothetical protein
MIEKISDSGGRHVIRFIFLMPTYLKKASVIDGGFRIRWQSLAGRRWPLVLNTTEG